MAGKPLFSFSTTLSIKKPVIWFRSQTVRLWESEMLTYSEPLTKCRQEFRWGRQCNKPTPTIQWSTLSPNIRYFTSTSRAALITEYWKCFHLNDTMNKITTIFLAEDTCNTERHSKSRMSHTTVSIGSTGESLARPKTKPVSFTLVHPYFHVACD